MLAAHASAVSLTCQSSTRPEERAITTTELPRADDARPEAAELDAAELRLLDPVPSGAAALAGVSVLLLLLGWLLVYLLIYLPRGMVG